MKSDLNPPNRRPASLRRWTSTEASVLSRAFFPSRTRASWIVVVTGAFRSDFGPNDPTPLHPSSATDGSGPNSLVRRNSRHLSTAAWGHAWTLNWLPPNYVAAEPLNRLALRKHLPFPTDNFECSYQRCRRPRCTFGEWAMIRFLCFRAAASASRASRSAFNLSRFA